MTDTTQEADDFPNIVAFDVRFHVSVEDFPFIVEAVTELADLEGFKIEFPAGEGLPTEHTLPIFAGVDDD